MNTYTETITTEVAIDLGKIWQDITGNYFSECGSWLPRVRYFTGEAHPWEAEEWTPDHKVALIYYDENSEATRKWLTAEDFAKARVELFKDKWTHCGHYGISLERGEFGFTSDDDACVNDAIVQTALFGEIIYG